MFVYQLCPVSRVCEESAIHSVTDDRQTDDRWTKHSTNKSDI